MIDKMERERRDGERGAEVKNLKNQGRLCQLKCMRAD